MSARRSLSRGSVFRGVLLLVVLACALGLGGCSTTQDVHSYTSPVSSVERLLELRAQRSTEASAYAEVVADESVAIALADSAQAGQDATVAPTPDWDDIYESSRETTSADVVVVWLPDADHPDWPVATVFTLESIDETWRTTDALEIGSADEVPGPLP